MPEMATHTLSFSCHAKPSFLFPASFARASWVWNAEIFRNTGEAGSLADAKNFAANMINSGMKFAFGTCLHDDKDIIWLTTWEEPEQGPVWPSGVNILKSEAHEGVQIGVRT